MSHSPSSVGVIEGGVPGDERTCRGRVVDVSWTCRGRVVKSRRKRRVAGGVPGLPAEPAVPKYARSSEIAAGKSS